VFVYQMDCLPLLVPIAAPVTAMVQIVFVYHTERFNLMVLPFAAPITATVQIIVLVHQADTLHIVLAIAAPV